MDWDRLGTGLNAASFVADAIPAACLRVSGRAAYVSSGGQDLTAGWREFTSQQRLWVSLPIAFHSA
ncbi:hypothetical protein ACWC9U_36380 [Streptomyces sp. 900116325]